MLLTSRGLGVQCSKHASASVCSKINELLFYACSKVDFSFPIDFVLAIRLPTRGSQ